MLPLALDWNHGELLDELAAGVTEGHRIQHIRTSNDAKGRQDGTLGTADAGNRDDLALASAEAVCDDVLGIRARGVHDEDAISRVLDQAGDRAEA